MRIFEQEVQNPCYLLQNERRGAYSPVMSRALVCPELDYEEVLAYGSACRKTVCKQMQILPIISYGV